MTRVFVCDTGGMREVPIRGSMMAIGRAEENDVRLFDPELSRHHCKILRTEGVYKLVDLGSRNGTVVNGRRVQWKVLVPGDVITLGATSIYFQDPPDGPEAAAREEPVRSETVEAPAIAGRPAPEDRGDLTFLTSEEGAQAPGITAEHIAKLRRLLDLNRAINSELDPKRVLERIIDACIEVTGAERGFLVLKEPGGEYRIKVSRNLDQETIRRAETKVSRSVLRRVVQEGETIVVDDAGRDDRFSQADSVIDLNLAAIIAAPLRARKEIIGAIYLDNRFRSSGFTRTHQNLLEVVVDQAAIALENARLFAENLAKQRELEAAHRELEELNRALKAKVARQDKELEEARVAMRKAQPALKHRYDKIITRSPRMFEMLGMVDKVVEVDAPVHIEGESGTGKELVARAIHDLGPRAERAFIAQNCAAIPQELMEAEFFGHEAGAFTGAEREKPGLFELADGGTLFLDEIGEMRIDLQSKFLRALQSGEIRRVGGSRTRQVSVRIISATNQDLGRLCREGRFREDLYYRVVVIHVKLPPLRERREDVPLLVEVFLGRIAERTGQPMRGCSEEALAILRRYHWPGNVRQLQNELERAVALSTDVIGPDHLSPEITEGRPALVPKTGPVDPAELETLHLKTLVRSAQQEVERAAIVEALRRAPTKSEAAQLLGVSRPTLDAKIDRYDIPWTRGRG